MTPPNQANEAQNNAVLMINPPSVLFSLTGESVGDGVMYV